MAETRARDGADKDTAAELASGDGRDAAAEQSLEKATGGAPQADDATAAMTSRHDRFAGSAVAVGSVGFDDYGVYTSADGPIQEGSDEELLIDGQEEVFARTEVERGRIEHHAGEDRSLHGGAAGEDEA